jgi:hypothetical protein
MARKRRSRRPRRVRLDWVRIFAAAYCQGRKVLAYEELQRKGVTRGQIDGAVRVGKLRCGVSGCWQPEAPDPGARALMCRAIKDPRYSRYQAD